MVMAASTATSKPPTRSSAKKKLGSVNYIETADFPNGVLPTKKTIVENMMYLLRPTRAGQGQRSKEDAAVILADLVQEHWHFCNVYTVTSKTIKSRVLSLYAEFTTLVQTRDSRRNEKFQKRVETFNNTGNELFDIFCEHSEQRKTLEDSFGVKMTEEEWNFLNDQRSERIMFCENFVDRKWAKTMERRRYDIQAIERMRSKSEQETSRGEEVGHMSELSEEEEDNDYQQSSTSESEPEDYNVQSTSSARKRRRFEHTDHSSGADEMPHKYQHLREGARKIRPVVYETMDMLKSSYHMSQIQAEAAVVIVGNKLFDRNWKFHDESDSIIGLDTLPHYRNTIEVGKSIEAMALDEIVKEIMESSEETVVTYHDDGSKKQGAGAFSVQGITVNRRFRPLPTFPIATESRENLADLKIAVLKVLEAASGVSIKTLFEKVNFVMTDQTSHNVNVEEIVAEAVQSDHNPSHLFCNVHPSLMFNRVITKQWNDIESAIGRDKIYSSFLVNATTNASSVTEQALDCTTRLINHDFDSKPWNKSDEFDSFIHPKKNKSVSLKDERFNRLTLTCAVTLYHLEDVSLFLEKFEHVTNQLACIVRCFIDLEFLKVLYCAGALLGMHLVEPFLSLTTSSGTTYSKLIPAFQQLYKDLISTDPASLLSLTAPAFSFVSEERFVQTKYDDDICGVIENVVKQMRAEIVQVLTFILPKLADGFQKQKGDIFGFGLGEETSQHALAQMDQHRLEEAPIHNLDAERSVGFINQELKTRGSKQLATASAAQVKARSADLIERRPSGSFAKYRKIIKPGGEIPEIMLAWQKKQEELMKQGLESKEIANIAVDRRRTRDLETLKSMGGPFTSCEEVEYYLENTTIEETVKNKRLYLEVRFARDTALSVPKTSDIFRLKKDYKDLPITTYAANLKVYLSNVTCKSQVNNEDFRRALESLAS